MTRTSFQLALAWALLLLVGLPGRNAAALDGRLVDAAMLQGIAALPAEVSHAALVVAGQPALLVQVDRLQQQTSDRFEQLLEPRSRLDQEAAWELVRHQGLVTRLAAARDAQETDATLRGYPAQVHAAAGHLQADRRLLAAMARLKHGTDVAFHALLEGHGEPLRAALQTVVAYPEAMETLMGDLGATVLLGEEYVADPAAMTARVEHLRDQAPPAPAASVDPMAGVPFADVAATYRSRYAYDPPPEATTETIVTYYNRPSPYPPYPYWYGYPRWYADPRWGAGVGWHVGSGVYLSAAYSVPLPHILRPVRVIRPYPIIRRAPVRVPGRGLPARRVSPRSHRGHR